MKSEGRAGPDDEGPEGHSKEYEFIPSAAQTLRTDFKSGSVML